MAYRNTRYKVVIKKDTYERVLGYTPRLSIAGLLLMTRQRADVIQELGIQDDDELKFVTCPRNKLHAEVAGWYIGFDGTTEKHP